MSTDTIIVPEEDRTIILVEEDYEIEVPAEWRIMEVADAAG